MLRGSIQEIGGVDRRALRSGRATVAQKDLRWDRKKCAGGERHRRCGGSRRRASRRGADRREAKPRPEGIGKYIPIARRRWAREGARAWARTEADRVYDRTARSKVLAQALRVPARKIARLHDGRRCAARRREDQIQRSWECEWRNRRERSWARIESQPLAAKPLAAVIL